MIIKGLLLTGKGLLKSSVLGTLYQGCGYKLQPERDLDLIAFSKFAMLVHNNPLPVPLSP